MTLYCLMSYCEPCRECDMHEACVTTLHKIVRKFADLRKKLLILSKYFLILEKRTDFFKTFSLFFEVQDIIYEFTCSSFSNLWHNSSTKLLFSTCHITILYNCNIAFCFVIFIKCEKYDDF